MSGLAAGRTLRLLVLRDSRPGEWHKAEGIAAVAARSATAEIETLDVAPRIFARNAVRLWALRHARADPLRALVRLYGIAPGDFTAPDVVIAAGRPTAAAGILIARACHARLIYGGFLRDYDPADLDLMLVASPRQAHLPRCALAPLPTRIDPDGLRQPRRLNAPESLAGAELSLLLGGGRRGYRFAQADWLGLASLVLALRTEHGVAWRIASSRRTPPAAAAIFAALAGEGIAEFVDAQRAGPSSADALFDADAVVTTEDSLTMIAEGLAAMRPVVALRPPGGVRHAYAEELVAMACGGGLAILPLGATSAAQLSATLRTLRPSDIDPRERIAVALRPILADATNSVRRPR